MRWLPGTLIFTDVCGMFADSVLPRGPSEPPVVANRVRPARPFAAARWSVPSGATMRAAGDDSFDEQLPRARPGDLSAPRSTPGRRADPLEALSRFVAEGAVERAAQARSRVRWQRQLAIEAGTWLGLLCDLAETGASVVIDTVIGRRVSGTITSVGVDFVVASTGDRMTVLALGAISTIQRADGHAAPAGRSGAPNDMTLPEFLTDLAVDRPTVTWHLSERQAVAAQLMAVGQGFVHLRTDGAAPSMSYAPITDHTMVGLDG